MFLPLPHKEVGTECWRRDLALKITGFHHIRGYMQSLMKHFQTLSVPEPNTDSDKGNSTSYLR